MTIDFNIGDEVWYGAYPKGARHHSKLYQIIADEAGIGYFVEKSNERHSQIYRTEKELVIASLKQDIKSHLDYVDWLKQQLKTWEEKQ